MDRSYDPEMLLDQDRRATGREVAAALLAAGEKGLSFEELERATTRHDPDAVSWWLAMAVQEGLVEELESGEMCFRVAPGGVRSPSKRFQRAKT